MTPELKDRGLSLYDCGGFKDRTHPTAIERPSGERGFELKLHEKNPEAPLSPFYLMLRTADNPGKPGPLTPEIVQQCSEAMAALVYSRKVMFERILGIPNAGEPFASVEAFAPEWPESIFGGAIQLHKATTEKGRTIVGPVEGKYYPGETVLLIDDLITRADTKLEAIQVLREAGLQVTDLVVIVNRSQGGEDQLHKAGCRLHTLFTIGELLELYRDNDRISLELFIEIQQYLIPFIHGPQYST